MSLRLTMQTAHARADIPFRQQCLDQAARCRRLALAVSDRQTTEALLALARDYERDAWKALQAGATI